MMRVVAAAVLLGACEAEPSREGRWTGSLDTLANGAVRVVSTAGDWAPGDVWTLTEELRLGSHEAGGPTAFNDVADVAMDAAGRIYVLDEQAKELRAFAADGGHLWTSGREGEGPGEFSAPVGVAVAPDGRIWIVDRRNQRFTVYDTLGMLVREVRRGRGGPFSNWHGGFDREGRLLDPSMVQLSERHFGPGVVLLGRDLEEQAVFAIPSFERPVLASVTGGQFRFSFPVPFTPDQIWHPDPATGSVWLGRTHPYTLARLSFSGDTLAVIERNVGLLPLTDEDRAEIERTLAEIRESQATADRSLIPDRKPRARWLEPAPDGHLWVRVFTEAGDSLSGAAYDVFEPDGRFLGTVTSPLDLRPGLAFSADAVVGVVRDELDVPWIVRLRLRRP